MLLIISVSWNNGRVLYFLKPVPKNKEKNPTLEHFGAPAQNVNFEADATRLTINKWVEKYTHSKINDLLPKGKVQVIQLFVRPIVAHKIYHLFY